MIDWAGKGAYDPVTRRMMFAGCGAGNNVAGGHRYNTHAIYSEASNTWSAVRGFRGSNQSSNTPGLVHVYDNNCISLKARRFYKKQFTADDFSRHGPIHQYDLDTNSWGPAFDGPQEVAAYMGNGAMDAVETRGTRGSLWYMDKPSGSEQYAIWEYDIALRSWTKIIREGAFPALSVDSNGPLLSVNPRAFNGAGGVLVAAGNNRAYTVRIDTFAVNAVAGAAPTAIDVRVDGHLCRDPAGSGWLLFSATGYVYRSDGSGWSQRAPLPTPINSQLGTSPMMTIPVDAYGVVHLITDAGASPNRAWIYRG